MSDPADLVLDRIAKRFGATVGVAETSLSIPSGTYLVLLGPSGSGKTTLLSMIGGFTPPSAGEIRLGGADITDMRPAQRPTATVFQDYALFPHLTVGDNVAFGLSVRGIGRAQRMVKAEDALRLVGLGDYGGRRIHELSGGQRQRVALARALVVEPAVLLLDEPLGALDLHLRRAMQDELKRLQRGTGRSFIHVTHDQEEAMALADLVLIMNQGRIEDLGPPERVYANPASRFAATFMGETNLIDGTVESQSGGILAIDTALGRLTVSGTAVGGAGVAVAIRPEHMRLGQGDGDAQSLGTATIIETAFQGSYVRLRARSEAGLDLLLKVPPVLARPVGTAVPLSAERSALSVLNA